MANVFSNKRSFLANKRSKFPHLPQNSLIQPHWSINHFWLFIPYSSTAVDSENTDAESECSGPPAVSLKQKKRPVRRPLLPFCGSAERLRASRRFAEKLEKVISDHVVKTKVTFDSFFQCRFYKISLPQKHSLVNCATVPSLSSRRRCSSFQ